ncbi:MAG: undecaprenyldiphospho-muramoylpentapeptide beta-N-acetylglucosaminyltransferase [Nitrospirae bacterium]|nr:undecaprenyldiphospho-muramoylpentapeptide beta-N-acetylglucosaminyltransferase [Nitrospirota bacterium]
MTASEKYKIVIAGGGTGGHLYPAIAIAEELKKLLAGVEILFMGTGRGIEARVLPAEKYFVKLLDTAGFVGVSWRKKIWAILKMVLAFFEAYSFLRSVKPDIVIGTGGYASFLPVIAAAIQGIPTVIHEQNSLPGLANKVLAKFATKVCITYESSLGFFPKNKTILTGNPVRERMLKATRSEGVKMFSLKPDRFTVFIVGGSAGARSINKVMSESLEFLVEYKDKIQFLHQSGESGYDMVRSAYVGYGFGGTVAPFIYNMPEAYATCDMIICRAGATTLAEITAIGIPSVLIPYPYAAQAHQEVNASRLFLSGAAFMIKEEFLNGKTLSDKIISMYADENLRNRLRRDCTTFGKPEAGKKVANIVVMLIRDKSPYLKQEYERCLTSTE